MTAIVLALALTAALLCAAAVTCLRRAARVAERACAETQPLPLAGPAVAALDDAAFRAWVGVPPATYDRYVDTGIEDLEIFLADQPARRVGEDPAEPST
jgi:hypothetical protein